MRQHTEHVESKGPQLITDSLRYWVTEMRVDGFRFDLASTLGREEHFVERSATLFDMLLQTRSCLK